MAQATTPEIGMLVTFTRHDHKHVKHGTGGVIDLVNRQAGTFWVLTDCGGFFGPSTFSAWEWTGSRMDRTAENEDWFAIREEVMAREDAA